MPQMNPMNWLMLTNVSISMLVIMLTQTYFTKSMKSKTPQNQKMPKSWAW